MSATIGKQQSALHAALRLAAQKASAPARNPVAPPKASSFEPARKAPVELRGFSAATTSTDAQRCAALGVIRRHFDTLDTAAGLGAKDGIIGRTDLVAAAANVRLPAELRSACQSLLSNPAALAQLDVASGYKQGDELFSLGDFKAEQYRLGAAALAQAGVRGSDGYVCKADLAAARRDPNSSPEARAVSAYFLDEPEALQRLDDAERLGALAALRKHFGAIDTAAGIGAPDGLVGKVDLQQAVRNGTLPAEARRACEYLLRHPDAFPQLDLGYGSGSPDDLVSMADVSAEQYRLGLSVLEANFNVLDTAAGVGAPDGLVGKVDLEAAVSNPALPRELRQTCEFLLGNQEFLDRLDLGAGFGPVDNLISPSDVSEQQLKLVLGVVERNLGALDLAAGVGAADGIVGLGDLAAAVNDASKPAEVRWAASWLVSHPAAFERLEKAAGIGGADGLFSSLDLDAMAGRRVNPTGVAGLAPAGLSERQRYDFYANIVRANGGQVNPGGLPTVLGLQGITTGGATHGLSSSRAYDDVFVVLTADGRAIELAGATHPGQSSSRASPDVTGDGSGDVGIIRPGNYLARPNGPHGGNSSWHVQELGGSGSIAGWRDTNHDGVYSDAERRASEARGDSLSGVLFHQGNSSAPSSIGCQTLSPGEFNRFISALGGAGATFTYTMVSAV